MRKAPETHSDNDLSISSWDKDILIVWRSLFSDYLSWKYFITPSDYRIVILSSKYDFHIFFLGQPLNRSLDPPGYKYSMFCRVSGRVSRCQSSWPGLRYKDSARWDQSMVWFSTFLLSISLLEKYFKEEEYVFFTRRGNVQVGEIGSQIKNSPWSEIFPARPIRFLVLGRWFYF